MNPISWIVDLWFSTKLTCALLHFLWQGCVGGVVVWAGRSLLRHHTARCRYALNVGTLIVMTACLPVTFGLAHPAETPPRSTAVNDSPSPSTASLPLPVATPHHDLLPGHSVEPSTVLDAQREQNRSRAVPVDTTLHETRALNAAVPPSDLLRTISPWVSMLYLSCVVLILARLANGVWGGERLRKQADVVEDPALLESTRLLAQRIGLRMVPTIAWCRQISVPVVVGIVKPMILLPLSVASCLRPDQLQALLLHELAHIRRFDPIVNLLQRVVEALLFFHPVVWFVSRRISIERELVADDMVLSAGWARPLYADALVRIAELSSAWGGPSTAGKVAMLGAVGTNSSEFKQRVLRLLEESPPPKLELGRFVLATIALLMIFAGLQLRSSHLPGSKPDTEIVANDTTKPEWGATTDGLRSRIRLLRAANGTPFTMADPRGPSVASWDELRLEVEIQNVGDSSKSLADVNDSHPAWLAEFIYSIDLLDDHNRLIDRVDVQPVGLDGLLDKVSVRVLKPGETYRAVLRPALWHSPYQPRTELGNYRIAIRYRGLPTETTERIRQQRPDSPVLTVMSTNVVSSAVPFVHPAPPHEQPAAENPFEAGTVERSKSQALAWGTESSGLRAAVEFVPQRSEYEHGEKLELKLHVRNVSNAPVTLSSRLWRPDCQVDIRNGQNEPTEVINVRYSGEAPRIHVTIKPQQTVVFDAGNLGLAATTQRARAFEPVTHRRLVAPVGRYTLRLQGLFGDDGRSDNSGIKPAAPLWGGTLMTSGVPLIIADERIPMELVDAVTGKPVAGTTVSFKFIKPMTADSEEATIAQMVWAPNSPSSIYFMIPGNVVQRADRDEIEVAWGVGSHPDYEVYAPTERFSLRPFFHEGPAETRRFLSKVRLTPVKLTEAEAVNGLEFLSRYPKLHELSLEMSEAQFQHILMQQSLKSHKSVEGKRTQYSLPMDDDHTVLVSFDNEDHKCLGIQRVRGVRHDVNDDDVVVRKRSAASILLPDHLNVMAVGFDPKTNELVSVSTESDVVVRRWSLDKPTHNREVRLEGDKHGNLFLSGHLTLSADCERVAAILDATVRVWDSQTGKQLAALPMPDNMQYGYLRGLACTPDFSKIACGWTPGRGEFGSHSAYAIVWDAAKSEVLQTVQHEQAVQVQCVALSPDGKLLATGGQSAGACLWKVETGERVAAIANDNEGQQHPDQDVSLSSASQVLCAAFSPDNQSLALGDMLGVKLVDARSGELKHRFDAPFRFGRSGLVFSHDGRWLARTATDKLVPIWSIPLGKQIFELNTEAHGGAFSNGDEWFAAGFSNQTNALGVWQLREIAKVDQVQNESNDESGEALADAVRQFNDTYNPSQRGIDQPPLTEKEVISAIERSDWKRDFPDATEREYAALRAIVRTRRLPPKAEFEVLTGMQPDPFTLIELWSIRVSLPADGRPGTAGFTIRDAKLGEQRIDRRQVQWGRPDADGLSLGLTLWPQKAAYQLGEQVELRLFVRNDGAKQVETSFPNVSWPDPIDLRVVDDTGATINISNGHKKWSEEHWIAGAMADHLRPGDVHGLSIPFKLAIGGTDPDDKVGRVVNARAGQTLRLAVRNSDGRKAISGRIDPAGESGAVEFAVQAAQAAVFPTRLRFQTSDTRLPLPNLRIEITNGYGTQQKSFGPFQTNDDGTARVQLPEGFYTVHLTSDREWPYLAVDELWNERSRGLSPSLNLRVTRVASEKWLEGKPREVASTTDEASRLTYSLLPACELIFRAVDVDTGKGLQGAEFYTENAAGEEWAHSIEGRNLGSQTAPVDSAGNQVAEVTDLKGIFRKWIGADSGYAYGVWRAPIGYETVDPGREIELDVVFGQKQVERVFKFRRSASLKTKLP